MLTSLFSILIYFLVLYSSVLAGNSVSLSFVEKPHYKGIIAHGVNEKGKKLEFLITSMITNPSVARSYYIDHIFGSKSLHLYGATPSKGFSANDDENSNVTSFMERNYRFYKAKYSAAVEQVTSTVNSTWMKPSPCSFEVLGFIPVDMKKNTHFTNKNRYLGPTIGQATLRINPPKGPRSVIDILCIYRALYENNYESEDKRVFWSLVFFCPIQSNLVCKSILSKDSYLYNSYDNSLNFNLTIVHRRTLWTAQFSSHINRNTKIYQEPAKKKSKSSKISQSSNDIGICTVLPYLSADPMRRKINSAVFITWLQYYLKLGHKIFVYDQSGQVYKQAAIYGYDLYQLIPAALHQNLFYHNFTVRGLLNPYSATGLIVDEMIDNQDEYMKNIRWIADQNKILTLTHCRFEAMAVANVKRVMAIDIDEFLYCPKAGIAFQSQREYMDQMIRSYDRRNIHQISIHQRVLYDRSSDTSLKDCLLDKTLKYDSIFRCYTSVSYDAEEQEMDRKLIVEKSLHLQHVCPLTGLQYSCSSSMARILNYNCQCQSESIPKDQCYLIHVTLNPAIVRTADTSASQQVNELVSLSLLK